MKGIGVDIVDLERLDINNLHFVQKILAPQEYTAFCQMSSHKRKLEYLGGRFAGKEAYMKAYHKGLGHFHFHDIIILNHDDGSPYLNDEHAYISISHEDKYAIAFVLVEK